MAGEYQRILKQFQSLLEHVKTMSKEKNADKIWEADAKALQEAMDIIADYEKATEQTSRLLGQYEIAAPVIRHMCDLYACPHCGERVIPGHAVHHCRRCGQRLAWDALPKKKKKGGREFR